MHFNRKKIKQSKLSLSPSGGTKKKIKTASSSPAKSITPVKRSKRKNRKLKIHPTATSKAMDVKNFGNRKDFKPISEWGNILEGHTSFILGNAPSISKQNLKILKPYFTLGVNRIFYVFTPTILMWQDIQMWNSEKTRLVSNKSLRICNGVSDPKKVFLNFKVKTGNFKFGRNPSLLHGTGNTTSLAIQLSVNLGCSSIVLLGTDCKYQPGKTDFYGNNKDHKSYTLKMCDTAMRWAKDNCPIPIYNCSSNKLWERENLSDVIDRIKPEKYNLKSYIRMFKK